MSFVVKKRDLADPAQLQALIVEHVDDLERGLTILDSRLLLGQVAIDAVAIDADGALVLMTLGLVADEEMLLKAVDAYSWCLEYPEAIRRLYPNVEFSPARPPRVMFVVERMPDAFHRKIKQLGFAEVDCIEFRHLDVDGTAAIYFDSLARLRRAAAATAEHNGTPSPPPASGRPTSLKLQKLLGADRSVPGSEPAPPVVRIVHRAGLREEAKPAAKTSRTEAVAAPSQAVDAGQKVASTVETPAAVVAPPAASVDLAAFATFTEAVAAAAILPEAMVEPFVTIEAPTSNGRVDSPHIAEKPRRVAAATAAAAPPVALPEPSTPEPLASREVSLRIIAPPTSTPEPAPLVTAVVVPEPAVIIQQQLALVIEAPQPVMQAPEPAIEAPKPVMPAPEPTIEAPQPVMQVAEPVIQMPQPVMQVAEPVIEAPQPVMQVAEPVIEAPQPLMQVAEPVIPAPQPVMPVAEPVIPAPVAEPVILAPQPVTPVAEPVILAPQSVMPVAEPVIPAPEPVMPVAEPVILAPQSVMPVAEPVIPAPELVMPVAEPVIPAPELVMPVAEPVIPAPEPVTPVAEPVIPAEPVIQTPELMIQTPEPEPVIQELQVIEREESLSASASPDLPELDVVAASLTPTEPEVMSPTPSIAEPEPVVPVLELEVQPATDPQPESQPLASGLPELIPVAADPVVQPLTLELEPLATAITSDPEPMPEAVEAVEPIAPVIKSTPSVFSRRAPEPAKTEPKVSFAGMSKDLLKQVDRPAQVAPPVTIERPSVEEITRATIDDLVGATEKPTAFTKPSGAFAKRPRTITPTPSDGPPIAGGPKVGGVAAKRNGAPPAAAEPAVPAEAEAAPAVTDGFEGLQFPNDGVLTRQWMAFLNQMAAGK
jgi:hypothetical protein